MNTKTTLLGLLGLVTVAGAGYFYTSDQDMSKVPQQIGGYLPEAVLDYLPESFSPETIPTAPAAVVASKNSVVAGDDVTQVEETTEAQDVVADTETKSQTETMPNVSNENSVEQETEHVSEAVAETSPDTIDADMMSDIEQSVADVSNQSTEKTTESAVINDPKTSKEAQELQRRIQEVNSKLAELDGEKETLEERFQKVLKQNRTLALKLKEIDEQLKVNMK